MKKNLIALILPLLLAGCGQTNFETLGIKKVAVISLRTDISMRTIGRGDSSDLINSIHDISKGALDFSPKDRLNEDEEFYIYKTMDSLKEPFEKWAAAYDVSMMFPEELVQSKVYQDISLPFFETSYLYSVAPYRNINEPSSFQMRELCKDLDVDALVMFRLFFEREAYRDIVHLPFTPDYLKLFAKLKITVFDKTGHIVIDNLFEAVSPEIIGYDKSAYYFSLENEDFSRVIEKTLQELRIKVNKFVDLKISEKQDV